MDERDHWRVPDEPYAFLKKPPAPWAFKAAWGVDYDVVMASMKQVVREGNTKARLFEKLGTPITAADLSVVMQMDNSKGTFWDRMTVWKVSQLPWYRRWQLKFLVWRHRIGVQH